MNLTRSFTQSEEKEMRANPAIALAFLNELLDRAAGLAIFYEGITGVTLPNIPDQIVVRDSGTLNYGEDGLSAPRIDGAVRAKAWDDAVEAALRSPDPVIAGWGRENENRRWIFIQDTLSRTGLSDDQRNSIILNCSEARFNNGLGGKGSKFRAWKASPLTVDNYGVRLADDQILDAFSLPSDLTFPDGRVRWRGARAFDIAGVAEESLRFYRQTSGPGYAG